ncbi:primosomal replication protein N [Nitrosomonas sp. HPC101]|uniref:primosomal replication protein N n=1 Tax=Nitrosomonas sp. HPC101 TaxID=1658667 RepID=UPI001370414C|nr:primosomal replication protein N [Nitrosomonas sp. HPC101]MXS85598.1 primosomal replication protein N [Nitrosomonas sp. HPC101]
MKLPLNLNQVVIGGKIIDLNTPRYTPVGIMITEFRLSHASNQEEAGAQRKIEFELAAIAMAGMAEKIACMGSGSNVELTGFVTKKNRLSNQLVLHVRDARIV